MIFRDKIKELALKKIFEINCFLVDIRVSPTNDIKVLFDNDDGITLEDCMKVSRHIEENLDRDVEDFKLTVCSPGLENPFIVKEQYLKYIGRDVKVKSINGEIHKGKLISYSDFLKLEILKKNKKNKKIDIHEIIMPIEEIKETKLIIKFK